MIILIVDDQRSARRTLTGFLSNLGDVQTLEAASLEEAREILTRDAVDVALIDIRLSADTRNRDGLQLVRDIDDKTRSGAWRADQPATVPIVVTVFDEMDEIRAAMQAGARDYILKDALCPEMIEPVIDRLRRHEELVKEVRELRSRQSTTPIPRGLVGASAAMDRLRAAIRRVAVSDRPALVNGPTGSGKELVVSAIHSLGPHPDDPLLDINCGAIPEHLIESQLFGHEKGAFTGAERRQDGYFSAVRSGTLFLDEIAELPLPLQAKLLRVLETGRFRSVGSTKECRFTGRVVAATHADLDTRVKQGLFREDLYYRLNVLTLRVPPLDERREDIPSLVAHFVRHQHRPLRFSSEALATLSSRDWPGNVRQLRNLVDRLAVFSDDEEITPQTLEGFSESLSGQRSNVDHSLRDIARRILQMPLGNTLTTVRDALISEAMACASGNKSAAARLLGVHRKAIERRLERSDSSD